MIKITQYDNYGRFYDKLAWASLDNVYIGNFEYDGAEWRFKTGLISGLTPIQLRDVADELEKFIGQK